MARLLSGSSSILYCLISDCYFHTNRFILLNEHIQANHQCSVCYKLFKTLIDGICVDHCESIFVEKLSELNLTE